MAAGAFAVTSSASDRSGTLKIFKECSEYTGLKGSFCTIKTSTLKQIKAGSKVVYLQPKALASDVILTSGTNKAYGNCALNKAGNGKCIFTRGTGRSPGSMPNSVSHTWAIHQRVPSVWGSPYSIG